MHTEIRQNDKKSLSVVLLCYNDAATIGDCVETAFRLLEPLTSGLQVIVVEDGSHDTSRTVLESLVCQYSTLEILIHHRNQGYSRSLGEGIQAARNEFVLCIDGDNQFDLKDAAQMLALADGRYQIISGCRRPRADPWYRRALGWIYNQSVRIIFRTQAQDVDCGFKLLDRRSAQFLLPIHSNLAAWVEIMTKAEHFKYRVANIMVHHRPRQSGRSTVFNFSAITRIGWETLCLGVRFKLTLAREIRNSIRN